MKIALSFPECHRRGGVERVVLETANFLASRGHETHLFASRWDDGVLDDRVTTHRVVVDRYPLAYARQFARHCEQTIADSGIAFDAHGGFGVMSPACDVRWMQSVHAAWLQISRQRRPLTGRLKQRLNPFHPVILHRESRVLRRHRHERLLALTPDVADDMVRHYDVPRGRIAVLPNGYAPEEFNPRRRADLRDAVRAELGYAPDDRIAIFVANESDRKGLRPLIEAMGRLDDPKLRLLCAGRLNESEQRNFIDAQGMAGRVHFTGPASDVARFYAAADLFALPTQYEAWGLVIVEAMACGLPVLTSRLAGASVAVREGWSGELLDNPADVDEVTAKLRTLLNRPAPTSEELAASVSRYQWAQLLQEYERFMVDAAGRHTESHLMEAVA